MHLNVLGMHIIVINSQKIAIDLMEKRSKIYSDRPYLAMAGELYVPFITTVCYVLLVSKAEWAGIVDCLSECSASAIAR